MLRGLPSLIALHLDMLLLVLPGQVRVTRFQGFKLLVCVRVMSGCVMLQGLPRLTDLHLDMPLVLP